MIRNRCRVRTRALKKNCIRDESELLSVFNLRIVCCEYIEFQRIGHTHTGYSKEANKLYNLVITFSDGTARNNLISLLW